MNIIKQIIEKIYLSMPGNIAIFDQLTGLYNRNYWDLIGKKKYEHENIYVTMIDMDDLKKINDTHGHAEGDIMLIRVANVMKFTFNRETDILIHLGGDEFLILTKEDPSARLFAVSTDFFCYGVYHKLENDSIYTACKNADKNMYKMKKEHKKGR